MDDVLTQAEADRLIEAARTRRHPAGRPYRHTTRDTLILRVMLECGLRASEVVQLDADSVFAGEPMLLVGRGAKQRRVPAPPDLTASLEEYTTTRGRLFELSTRAIEQLVSLYARHAGIVRSVRPYTLRRTFAQWAFPNEIPTLEELARALGVESAEAAARYLSNDLLRPRRIAAAS